MFGGIDVTWPQITDQQLVSAKDIERQEAVIIVVAVEGSAHLRAVHPVIGAIKIQDQFFGRGRKTAHELFKQYLMHNQASFRPARFSNRHKVEQLPNSSLRSVAVCQSKSCR